MAKPSLFLFVSITAVLSSVQFASAETACPAPTGDAKALFDVMDGAKTGALDAVRTFLANHTVAPDALNDSCETPLLYSIAKKEFDVFHFLFDFYKKPDVNLVIGPDGDQGSIYDYSLRYGDWDLVNFLKQAGGNLSAESSPPPIAVEGFTDLMMAAAFNTNPEVIKTLIQNEGPVDQKDSDGMTALVYAAEFNSAEIVKTLIDAKAHVDSVALVLAAGSNSDVEVFKLLIQNGARINYTIPGDGDNALALATWNDNTIDVVRVLIQAGINVDHANKAGMTPLCYAAASNSNVEVAKLLLQKGANVNHAAKTGETPLIDAAANNPNVEMINVLIKAGANVNHKTKEGDTALTIARETPNPNPEVAKAIIAAGGH